MLAVRQRYAHIGTSYYRVKFLDITDTICAHTREWRVRQGAQVQHILLATPGANSRFVLYFGSHDRKK